MLTLADIQAAEQRIRPYLSPSPVAAMPLLPGHAWAKLEFELPTRAFKVRGALNALLSLSQAEQARGVITASSGNHAQAIAYASHLTGISALVMMPVTTPAVKIERSRAWGAQVRVEGADFDETERLARRIAHATGRVFVSPYNHRQVAAGQGTIGLELAQQMPQLGRVVVAVGGGGLISGLGTALRALRPAVEIVGVNTAHTAALYNHLHGTAYPEVGETLADALSGGIEAGSITLAIAPRVIDRLLLVPEAAIAPAMRWLHDQHGWLVEGSGAAAIAPLLNGQLATDERATAFILCGGNVNALPAA